MRTTRPTACTANRAAIAHEFIALAVDRAGCAGKSAVVFDHIFETNLLAVDSGSSFANLFDVGCWWQVSYLIAFGMRDQLPSQESYALKFSAAGFSVLKGFRSDTMYGRAL